MDNNVIALKKSKKGGFIDFISDFFKNDNADLINEFKSIIDSNNPVDLMNWFQGNGYDVSFDECVKVIEKKDVIYQGKNIDAVDY